VGDVSTDDILELNSLEIVLDTFIRVQLRRIARQTLKPNAF
jgi:hypothetical protein